MGNNKNDIAWKAGLYIRLSREDEGEKEESVSITSQREILKEYVRQHPDIEIFDIYADDGFSGTNFERPQFKRMIGDITSGNINCVIVKDLSRFCRNAVDGGYYLDDFFTRHGIRFISINNCLDTFSNSMNASARCITVGVQNVINESVAATTSVNVRGTLNMTREKGLFIGSFPTYGYIKDPLDRHKLLIDERAASVVRDIFSSFISGKSILGITKELNERGIPNPSLYRKMQDKNYNHPASSDGLWPESTVRRILHNEIYTGNMVQGKSTTMSYKIKKCVAVPRENWMIVENTHEAVIDKDTFALAQSIFEKRIRTCGKEHKADVLSGLIKCADCKRKMTKKTNIHPYGTYSYYRCSTWAKMKSSACKSHSIRKDKIENAVLESLKKIVEEFSDIPSVLEKANKFFEDMRNDANKKDDIVFLKREKLRFEQLKAGLYEDWKDGILSKEEYLKLKNSYSDRIEAAEKEIIRTEEKIKNTEKEKANFNSLLTSLEKYKTVTVLTRQEALELIKEIYIHEDGSIEIFFKFKDVFESSSFFKSCEKP